MCLGSCWYFRTAFKTVLLCLATSLARTVVCPAVPAVVFRMGSLLLVEIPLAHRELLASGICFLSLKLIDLEQFQLCNIYNLALSQNNEANEACQKHTQRIHESVMMWNRNSIYTDIFIWLIKPRDSFCTY